MAADIVHSSVGLLQGLVHWLHEALAQIGAVGRQLQEAHQQLQAVVSQKEAEQQLAAHDSLSRCCDSSAAALNVAGGLLQRHGQCRQAALASSGFGRAAQVGGWNRLWGVQQAQFHAVCPLPCISCLLASASMLHMLCRLLMLYCLLLQAGAGGPRQHRQGGFRSQRLQLQSSDGSLPPAGPTQSTGRAVLGQSQSTLEVPCLPSGEVVHRKCKHCLTTCISLGLDLALISCINPSRHQPHVKLKHLAVA